MSITAQSCASSRERKPGSGRKADYSAAIPSLTSADDVAKALNVDPSHGLSEEEAKRRLAKFGPNELASAPPVPKWKKFLAQFQDPLVYLLIAATIISVIAWFIRPLRQQPRWTV